MPHHDKSDDRNDNLIGNSMSTDLGTYIPIGKRMGYLPKIFTDPKAAETLINSDKGKDSETENPQIPFIRDYCRTCISKWHRCLYKPVSDWDEDPINIITQTDSPSNDNKQHDKHPLPSDWSENEKFWNGKEYKKTRPQKPRYRFMPPPK